MAPDAFRLVTTSQAADQLDISRRVIYAWAYARSGPPRLRPAGRRGRELVWSVDDLLKLERDTRKKRASAERRRQRDVVIIR